MKFVFRDFNESQQKIWETSCDAFSSLVVKRLMDDNVIPKGQYKNGKTSLKQLLALRKWMKRFKKLYMCQNGTDLKGAERLISRYQSCFEKKKGTISLPEQIRLVMKKVGPADYAGIVFDFNSLKEFRSVYDFCKENKTVTADQVLDHLDTLRK